MWRVVKTSIQSNSGGGIVYKPILDWNDTPEFKYLVEERW